MSWSKIVQGSGSQTEEGGKPTLVGEIDLQFQGVTSTSYLTLPRVSDFNARIRFSIGRDEGDPSDSITLGLRQEGGGTIFLTGHMNSVARNNYNITSSSVVSFSDGDVFVVDGIFKQGSKFADLRIFIAGVGLTAKCYMTVRSEVV